MSKCLLVDETEIILTPSCDPHVISYDFMNVSAKCLNVYWLMRLKWPSYLGHLVNQSMVQQLTREGNMRQRDRKDSPTGLIHSTMCSRSWTQLMKYANIPSLCVCVCVCVCACSSVTLEAPSLLGWGCTTIIWKMIGTKCLLGAVGSASVS